VEKSIAYQLFHMPGVDTDSDLPDRDAVLDADPDPDPANGADTTRCGSGSTTLHKGLHKFYYANICKFFD
jgi:hypothetical protein